MTGGGGGDSYWIAFFAERGIKRRARRRRRRNKEAKKRRSSRHTKESLRRKRTNRENSPGCGSAFPAIKTQKKGRKRYNRRRVRRKARQALIREKKKTSHAAVLRRRRRRPKSETVPFRSSRSAQNPAKELRLSRSRQRTRERNPQGDLLPRGEKKNSAREVQDREFCRSKRGREGCDDRRETDCFRSAKESGVQCTIFLQVFPASAYCDGAVPASILHDNPLFPLPCFIIKQIGKKSNLFSNKFIKNNKKIKNNYIKFI